MDWLTLIQRHGLGAAALLLLMIYMLVDLRDDVEHEKHEVALEGRVIALENRQVLAPEETRFGKEVDRRLDRLEDIIYPHRRYPSRLPNPNQPPYHPVGPE